MGKQRRLKERKFILLCAVVDCPQYFDYGLDLLSTLRLYDCMISIDWVLIFTHDCDHHGISLETRRCPHSSPSNWSSGTRALINIYRI